MNRICIEKTGKLIEMQSGGDDNPELMESRLLTLKQNALNNGYIDDEIECKWITDEEWLVIKTEINSPLYGKTPAEIIEINKQKALADLVISQKAIQDAGMTCSNGIKLQVGESDLIRWTQLMMNVMAFSPATVQIRDYNNVTHTLQTSTEVVPMLAEVAVWGQAFLAETWRLKDEIINAG